MLSKNICLYLIWFTLLSWVKDNSLAQNFNPPFPRIGQVTFYPIGAGPEIWKNHDFIMIRHYQGDDARRIKEKNPDVLLLAGNNYIGYITGFPKDPPECWYAHDSNGNRIRAMGGYLMDVTNNCCRYDMGYGPQRFNEYLAQFLANYTDWRYFDGTLFDSWRQSGPLSGWEEGLQTLVQNLRRRVPDKIIIAHESNAEYLNGNAFEFWSRKESKSSNLNKALNLLKNAQKPVVIYCNGDSPLDDFAWFRADFTSAQLVDGFYGHDEGTVAHRYTFLHDEYEADLGYPTTGPQEIEAGLWVRYFDKGVIISNISGERKTVYAHQIQGGPYYRFKGSQDPEFNNGSIFDEAHPIHFEEFDGILLFKQPTTLITPIVIDNVALNMTSIDQNPTEFFGSWIQTKEGENAYSLGGLWDEYKYFHAYSLPGNGENVAIYRPIIKVAGNYEVFEWHGRLKDKPVASNVPYEIHYSGGIKRGTIDQTKNIGRWNSLGIYYFDKGTSGYVKITNKANGYVISDAVRFVFGGIANNPDTTPPTPPTGVRIKQ